ncbi:thioredoxin-disulfide reductase [Actinomycetospora sp. NBRC 106375]|uniref:thioredoxin-disulfide reductase n=1 Tax=Actinomycetospora sp. NBRC 106375 TaxID=3032207 RepID=UPI00255468FF|nr:thioredoxin-disulfide reductase [Actinomycetospora sp. NBRC 106375]
MSDQTIHDVIIVGSGPAGYTAAVYAARAQLDVLVFEGSQFGGALMTTTGVENYPGFADEIQGPELMDRMRRQAERFGTDLRPEDVDAIDLTGSGDGVKAVRVDGTWHRARAIILAMGAQARYLGVPGEEKLLGRGVSACATCDGFFFREHDIVVVGGGDSAMEEATFLTRFARSVTILHRRSEFRASAIMLERAKQDPKITIRTDTVVEEVLGENTVEGVRVRNVVTGEEETLAVTGFFVAVGHDPRSGLVRDAVDTDDEGYVRVALPGTGTNLPGVFACGDLVDHTYRQAITAAGSGCQAAIDAERWLAEQADAGTETAPPPTPGVDGGATNGLASVGPATSGGSVGSVDEGSPEPAGDAVPAPS